MEGVVIASGIAKMEVSGKSLLTENSVAFPYKRLTVQQALCRWYISFKDVPNSVQFSDWLFPGLVPEDLLVGLKTDIELVPSVLMEEFINNLLIQDKVQYIRLVQTLLLNLSDVLYSKEGKYIYICIQIKNTLEFIQNFFCQYFDFGCRVPLFCSQQFQECSKLKIDYLQLKLNHSILLGNLQECLIDKFITPENNITYRKIHYLKSLLQKIESATSLITEDYIRETFIYNNFNSECFITYEIELIKTKLCKLETYPEIISFLQSEQSRIASLKTKSVTCFDIQQPSLKKQLTEWVTNEIKQLELYNLKSKDKDLVIDPESKIKTSLSVAKLAVLVRLLVIDKIIINRTVAPMLKTVSKLFTTLQKDEISFGSLETKYHAPDKATVNMVKDMLLKWISILGKL